MNKGPLEHLICKINQFTLPLKEIIEPENLIADYTDYNPKIDGNCFFSCISYELLKTNNEYFKFPITLANVYFSLKVHTKATYSTATAVLASIDNNYVTGIDVECMFKLLNIEFKLLIHENF